MKYELGFYIPEEDIRYCHRREKFKSYINVTFGLSKQLINSPSNLNFEKVPKIPHVKKCYHPEYV
jgi:hypothetical protein